MCDGKRPHMIQRERMVNTLIDLVQIDSQSKEEILVAQWLVRELQDLGADARVDDAGTRVGGNSGNVVAKIAGTAPDAPPLLLSAHMDTVPPGNGVKPVRASDRVKTDGTTVLGGDDKSGLAVILEVLRTLKEKAVPHGDLEIAFSICEEIGLLGAKNLDFGALLAREAIVLDSPHASLCTTQAPSADRFEFVVHGLEAHAGIAPENGISAVRIASEAIAAMPLGRIDPRTTSNVVIVEGGLATNVVPNRCVVRGEARSRPPPRSAAAFKTRPLARPRPSTASCTARGSRNRARANTRACTSPNRIRSSKRCSPRRPPSANP